MALPTESMKNKVISAFFDEFGFVANKFEIMDLLENGSALESEIIKNLALPSEENNIVWHPGVYVFLGNNKVYRVGVSLRNSRYRVMQHIDVGTGNSDHSVLDIDKFPDRSILLFNIKNKDKDRHWLLALECFLESTFCPIIAAKRLG